jgi:putative hemolysin
MALRWIKILFLFLITPAVFASNCEITTAKIANKRTRLVFTPESGLRFVVGDEKSSRAQRLGARLTRMASPFWLHEMNGVLQGVSKNDKPIPVHDKMLEALKVDYQTHALAMDSIPKTGPLIVPATHPLFGLDGLTILAMLKKVRSDVKIVATSDMMDLVPGFEKESIGVELEGDVHAGGKALRKMADWVKDGHALVIFPSGRITTSPTRPEPWSRSIAMLARRSEATVLPIFVKGQPGLFYRSVNKFIGGLKKSFYPVEILKRRGSTVDLVLGDLISPDNLSKFSSDEEAINFIRDETYQLGRR